MQNQASSKKTDHVVEISTKVKFGGFVNKFIVFDTAEALVLFTSVDQ